MTRRRQKRGQDRPAAEGAEDFDPSAASGAVPAEGGAPPAGETYYARREAVAYLDCSEGAFSSYLSRGWIAAAGYQWRQVSRSRLRSVPVYAESALDELRARRKGGAAVKAGSSQPGA